MTQWRAVDGYQGRYEVSDDGQVRALAGPGRGRLNATRVLKIQKNTNGYWQVLLYSGGGVKPKAKRVHNMMLEAFVGPRPPDNFGRHVDDNPDNNQLSNLRWGTRSDNSLDMVTNGNHNHARKTHCKWGHLLEGDNLIVTKRQRSCRTCKHRVQAEYYKRQEVPSRPAKACPACGTEHTRRSKFCSEACRARAIYRAKVGTPIDAPLHTRIKAAA